MNRSAQVFIQQYIGYDIHMAKMGILETSLKTEEMWFTLSVKKGMKSTVLGFVIPKNIIDLYLLQIPVDFVHDLSSVLKVLFVC